MPLGAELAAVLRALQSPRRVHVWLWLVERGTPVPIAEAALALGIPPRHLQRDLSPLVEAGLARWATGSRVAVGSVSLTALADRAERMLPLGGLASENPRLETALRHGVIDHLPPDPELQDQLLAAAAAALPDFDELDEPGITALLEEMAVDPALLRRRLVDTGRLVRSADGSSYRRSAEG